MQKALNKQAKRKPFQNIIKKIKLFFHKFFHHDLLNSDDVINYIFSVESLPEPLNTEDEIGYVQKFQLNHDNFAKSQLIEHNLRLVMYIAKKFESTRLDLQDLVSVGSIGLIKAVESYKLDKNIKLATYASRCIENEILMYLRKANKSINDLSLDDTLTNDEDGSNLSLGELIPDEKQISEDMENNDQKTFLLKEIENLSDREKTIMYMRYGLNGYDELTQKDIADIMNISQSYISRLEKKILSKLKRELNKNF